MELEHALDPCVEAVWIGAIAGALQGLAFLPNDTPKTKTSPDLAGATCRDCGGMNPKIGPQKEPTPSVASVGGAEVPHLCELAEAVAREPGGAPRPIRMDRLGGPKKWAGTPRQNKATLKQQGQECSS